MPYKAYTLAPDYRAIEVYPDSIRNRYGVFSVQHQDDTGHYNVVEVAYYANMRERYSLLKTLKEEYHDQR